VSVYKFVAVETTRSQDEEGRDEHDNEDESDADAVSLDREEGEGTDDDADPVAIGDMLNAVDLDGVQLPSHQRCAAHLMNLLATTDAKTALETSAQYRKVCEATDAKLRVWWRRQNRSEGVSTVILNGLGILLKVPGETRWNSEYDAKSQVTIFVYYFNIRVTNEKHAKF